MNFSSLKQKTFWNECLSSYVIVMIILCVTMVLGRGIWLLEIFLKGDYTDDVITSSISSGLLYDGVLLWHIVVFFLLPYICLYLIKPLLANICSIICIVLYGCITFLLDEYLLYTSNNLDHIICIYSIQELIQIVHSSTSISMLQISLFLLNILIAPTFYFFISQTKIRNLVCSLAILIFSAIGAVCVDYSKLVKDDKRHETVLEYKYSINQISYLVLDCYNYFISLHDKESKDYDQTIEKYRKIYSSKEFFDTKYPLLHKINDNDVLGTFFNITDSSKIPNFVFLIVESMGQQYTGLPQTKVPLMPFIDSLKANSLYWQNCLSTAERTFAVLPSVLASAPHGSHGFANDWTLIPDHNSLIKDMAKNGYYTSYFYGGDNEFDGQQDFLSQNSFSYIMDARKDTSSSYYIEKTHRWGMDDAEMFRKAIDYKKTCGATPFVDVYQTLSTHEPCIVPDKQYETRVKKMADTLHFSCPQEERNYREHLNMYACFLYTDDCIRWLFNEYKKRKDFENTIFVIMGDHRMGNNVSDINSPIQKYHVPLIIYSPMLKCPRTMRAIVSHWDIAPTINAFLQKNFSYSVDSTSHWMGNALDTVIRFESNQTLSFMLNNRNVEDFLQDTLLLSKGRLYTVDSNMCCHTIFNDEKKKMMEEALSVSNDVSQYVCANNKLVQIDYQRLTPYFEFQQKQRVSCKKEFLPFIEPFVLKENVKNIYVDVSFDYLKHSSTKKNPDVVVAVSKNKEQVYYKKWPIPDKNEDMVHVDQHSSHRIYVDVDTKDAEVSIYLWNKDFCKFSCENVLIKVYCE